jgi:hypothetical protein
VEEKDQMSIPLSNIKRRTSNVELPTSNGGGVKSLNRDKLIPASVVSGLSDTRISLGSGTGLAMNAKGLQRDGD